MLAKEEDLWRLKSRDIWIKEGDSNTKIFHRHAMHRKNINTILEIKDLNREMVCSFKEKADAGERFFKKLFTELEGCNTQEILKVLSMFLRLISEEMNNSMSE